MKNKIDEKRKAGIKWGLVSGIIIFCLVAYATFPRPILQEDDEGTWHVIWEGNLAMAAENNPGAGVSGWLSTFCLDYAETPETCLQSNASGGQYDTWGNVSGYVSTDDTDTDLASEDPFYFVVRCIFNDTVKDGGTWNFSRMRVRLNTTGDETVSLVYEYDNSTSDGDAVVSSYITEYIWINFWWDDGVDGYRITDDGTINWWIQIEGRW